MNTEQQDPENWTKPVKIVCPECDSVQDAIVEGAWPWPIYVHHCTNCKHIIMESEWNELKDDSDMLFHECPNCNNRCNCVSHPCSCCETKICTCEELQRDPGEPDLCAFCGNEFMG